MSVRKGAQSRVAHSLRTLFALLSIVTGLSLPLWAGNNQKDFVAVGGVHIDTEGVLRNPTIDDIGLLKRIRIKRLEPVAADIDPWTDMRMVSLKGLEAAVAEQHRKIAPLTDELRYLAGLQRIEYVFVYPELNDIVIAGPAEGWKVGERGDVVGKTTGRPVMLLDDLLVALRTAKAAADGGLSCSIDPTPEGLARLQTFLQGKRPAANDATLNALQDSLGMQNITLRGMPPATHFARVLVAADYRMKRFAMAFEDAPVQGMPSYLKMISGAPKNMMPRWWLTTNYDSLLKDPDGLAWQIRGSGVKAMTEDDILAANGSIQHSGKSSPAAQKWADTMTEKYDELSAIVPIFGELRNVMDMAIVGALIEKEGLCEKAGFEMPLLMNEREFGTDDFEMPRQVPSMASVVKKPSGFLISVSGGVEISSWTAIENVEESAELADVHTKSTRGPMAKWWWN